MKIVIAGLVGAMLSVGVGAQSVIEGQVRLASGEPAVGARIMLFDLTDLSRYVEATADESGQFVLSLGVMGAGLPAGFGLGQNYPNPFNPATVIPYELAVDGYVRLEIFNLLGQRVATLVDGEQGAGRYTARWDARDGAGHGVAAGVYIYRLIAGGGMATRRLVLVDGPTGAVGSAAGPTKTAMEPMEETGVYGLTVSGAGLETYIDADFRVGSGPVEVVVEVVVEAADSAGRGKAATGGILGDVNDDNRVDVFDALLVALYSVDSSTAIPGDIAQGDVNSDGQVDLSDAYLIATYLTNPSDPSLPPELGRAVESLLSPVAVARADQGRVEVGGQVTLRGDGSSDPSGDKLTYHWSQVASNPFPVGFSHNDSENAFAVRATLTDPGVYQFVLEVENEAGLWSAPDTVGVLAGDDGVLSFPLPGGGEMEFVWIRPGVFQMGSPDSEEDHSSDEGPVHEVEISRGFWLGKYEVTQAQWEAVMGTRPWEGKRNVVSDPSHPAVYISWYDVQDFISQLNAAAGDSLYRLPTEAEWEYACRAGTQTRWSFGDDESQLTHYAWYNGNSRDGDEDRYAHAVGTKWANPWGLYDMHGNVLEWVQDWYDSNYYTVSPRVDPQGPTSTPPVRHVSLFTTDGTRSEYRVYGHVYRGGDFFNGPHVQRSAFRWYAEGEYRNRPSRPPPVNKRSSQIGVRLLKIR